MKRNRKILASLGLLAVLALSAYLYRVPLALAASPVELWFNGAVASLANPFPVQCSNCTGGGGGAVTNAGTFAVQNTAATPAGAALIGKVGIDQTTPDSTNLVSNKLSVATFVSGVATQTSTTSTSLIGAVATKSIYVTSWNCGNSGASASTIIFQDGSAGTTLGETMNPAGGGSNSPGGGVLFKTTAGNALFFAPGTGSTTQFCSAAGFSQ